jgi:phosphoribosylanthranilate isomerase
MKVKVCGMRDPENIRALESTKEVDFMGFIFYPPSPRHVTDSRDVIEAVRRCGKKKVGVFVNETVENMLQKAELYRLDCLQLHGEESPDTCGLLRAAGYGVIKSFPIGSNAGFEDTDAYRGSADYLLFDTKSAVCGGSGKRFDWSLLGGYDGDVPFLLSGGLSADCLHDILLFRHPWFAGVDINSGFELAAGIKDIEKIKAFTSELRGAKARKMEEAKARRMKQSGLL